VRFDGSPRTTTYVSANSLQASILASDISSTGSHNITVVNPTPGGGTSNAVTFTVSPTSTGPVITSISPSTVTAGGAAFTLTVNGINFVASNTPSTVRVNGVDRATTVVSSTQLQAAIPASDIATAGNDSITVFNAGPNNQGTSNAVNLNVTTGTPSTGNTPVITSLSPASRAVGSAGFTLTVHGANFTPNSVVRFDGQQKTTAYVSGNILIASIPASDVSSVGNHAVTVTDPEDGTSNNATFLVTQKAPVPGLPNTGFGPAEPAGNSNSLLTAIAGVLTALAVSFYASRKAVAVKK
jgi:hypothetical protein